MKSGHETAARTRFDRDSLRVHRNVERALKDSPQEEGAKERDERSTETYEWTGEAVTRQCNPHYWATPKPGEKSRDRQHCEHRTNRRPEQRDPERTITEMKVVFDVGNVRRPGSKDKTLSEENRDDGVSHPSSRNGWRHLVSRTLMHERSLAELTVRKELTRGVLLEVGVSLRRRRVVALTSLAWETISSRG